MGFFDSVRSILGSVPETDKPIPFEDVKDDFQFTGFTDAQKDTILGQLEQVWGTESGQDMLQNGLDGNGLHYLNLNSESVLQTVGPTIGRTAGGVTQVGNFALPSQGEVYLNAYDGIDPATGKLEVYTDASLAGQTAAGDTPINSLDENGEVFSVPPIYTMIHETNHTANSVGDLSNTDFRNGKYYSGPTITDGTTPADYIGPNEQGVREILDELGMDQHRGAYTGSWLSGRNPGEDYGLDTKHSVGVTPGSDIDMSGHAPVSSVLVSTDGVSSEFRLGNDNDTVHAFDGKDTIYTGNGNDRIFAGLGDDTIHAGWGNNTLDGGQANLDPASNHLSDSATNWGIDTVDYTALTPGFFAPNDISADGVSRDGIMIDITGDTVSVAKGRLHSVVLNEDVDVLNNVDIVRGTTRDDLTVADGFTGDRLIDGGAGVDTLRTTENVSNVASPGTFNGAAYDGYLEAGSAKLYYTNYENIDIPDASIDLPLGPVRVPPVDNSLDGLPDMGRDGMIQLPMREALEALRNDIGSVGADHSEATQAIFKTLVEDGRTHIDVSQEAMAGTPNERAGEIARAGAQDVKDSGLTDKAAETFEQIHNPSAEIDLQAQQYADYERTVEAETYDHAL